MGQVMSALLYTPLPCSMSNYPDSGPCPRPAYVLVQRVAKFVKLVQFGALGCVTWAAYRASLALACMRTNCQ